MGKANPQHTKITDKPLVPADARPDELAALDAFVDLAARFRAAGGTLVARIEGRFRGPERSVVYTFYRNVAEDARRLQNTVLGRWCCRTRLLVVASLGPIYCRTPAEAEARARELLVRFRGKIVRVHKPVRHTKPSTNTVREPSTGRVTHGHRVNRKSVETGEDETLPELE